MSGTYPKPLPRITELDRPFWDFARRDRLALQVCRHCHDAHFPPSPVCPRCLGEDQEWQPVRGTGTLESWIDVHRAYWPGFAGDLPYRVCLVLLDEGVRIISNLVGPSEDARLGARVTAVFETATDQISIPKFTLHEADHPPAQRVPREQS
jgi:uncharacterized OB-fold protein